MKALLCLSLLPGLLLCQATGADLDVVYVSTPEDVVDAMLELAKVSEHDVVYDLGCGDGRIVVEAARRWGCRGVGVDLSQECVQLSHQTASKANVSHLVEIRQADIFETDLSGATVVTLYLLPELNRRLVPQLEKMKPGSRIIAHNYEGLDELGIVPEAVVRVVSREDNVSHVLYLWKLPFVRKAPPAKP